MCKVAWQVSRYFPVHVVLRCDVFFPSQTLEKQEQCDESVEKLVVELASMLPMIERVKKAATLPQLHDTVETLMHLIEDASWFVIKYRTEGGPSEYLCPSCETLTDRFNLQ